MVWLDRASYCSERVAHSTAILLVKEIGSISIGADLFQWLDLFVCLSGNMARSAVSAFPVS